MRLGRPLSHSLSLLGVIVALALTLPSRPGPAASSLDNGIGPDRMCAEAVALAERAEQIPRHLLGAIAQAESGRPVAADRVAGPWPWTVNALGQGLFYDTKAAAMEAVDTLLSQGERNIDVGCMQVNLGFHPDAFRNLEEAFDPLANAVYGAAYLKALFIETGSWPEAVGRYHSATHARNTAYRNKVLDLWNRGRGRAVMMTSDEQQGQRRMAPMGPGSRPATGFVKPDLAGDTIAEIKSRLGAMAPP